MELFNYGFMYNPVLGGKLTLNSSVSYPSDNYELEVHLLSGDPLTSQYPVAKLPISTTDAVIYKTSTGTLSFDSSNWTIANTAEKKPVRMAFQYTAANVGTEMRALIDEADGAGIKDLGTQTSNSNNSFLYFGTFSTDAKISRIILRDGPGGAILHDFDANKVPNSAQTGFVQRDDPDALAGSADIMYDVVGGRTATPDNAGAGAFQVFGSVELVNGQADNIPLVAGETLTFTATRFDPENITITQDAKTLPLLNIQYDVNTGTGSADVPAVGNVTGFPHTEKSATLNFITSVETQTRTVNVGLPAHLTTITLTGIQDTGVNSLFNGWADPPTTGDEVPHDPMFYTMNFDSSYDIVTSDPNFSTTGYFIDSEGMESYEVNTTGAVVGESPTANAGADQANIAAGATVTLDGSGSSDSDGTITTYAWTQTAGDTVTLSDASVASPTFTAPSTASAQTLTFQLTVTDNDSNTASDTVNIGVLAAVIPTATITSQSQTVNVGDVITLTADTTNADTFAWSADLAGTFANAAAEDTTFTASEAGTVTVTLTVTSSTGDTASDSQSHTVNAAQGNTKPVAQITIDAGPFAAGSTINVSGSGSTDADSDPLTYSWTASAGVTISDATAESPTLTLPSPSIDTQYTLTLVVNDGTENSDPINATFTVSADEVLRPVTVEDLDYLRFEVITDGSLGALESRQNREGIRFKLSDPAQANEYVRTVVDNGATYLDLSQQNIDRIVIQDGTTGNVIDNLELQADGRKSIRVAGHYLYARLGDLETNNNVKSLSLVYILYVDGDTLGLVITKNERVALDSATNLKKISEVA